MSMEIDRFAATWFLEKFEEEEICGYISTHKT